MSKIKKTNSRKSKVVSRSLSRNSRRFSVKQTFLFVISFALIGTVLIYLVFAGTLSPSNEQDQFNRINSFRASQGVAAVSRSKCLTSAAREWAQHMAALGLLMDSDGTDGTGHLIRSGEPGMVKLIEKYCPSQWFKLGENVGVGGYSDEIFIALSQEPAHRAILVDPAYNLVGVGGYLDDKGSVWVAHLFAKCPGCSAAWTDPPSSVAETTPVIVQTFVAIAAKKDGTGHWASTSAGEVAAYNSAGKYGDLAGRTLNKPIVGMAATPTYSGYWLVASDGGVFAFGDAGFYGSAGGLSLAKPIVGMATTPNGKGYWLVGSDGGIFAYGNAGFYGSMGGKTLSKPIVGMAATPSGGGYWLVASDGGIFAFGDAGFYGSTGSTSLNKPIVGMAATPSGGGYWLVASDGGIFAFGNAGFYGSAGGLNLAQPVVGMVAMGDSKGYAIIQAKGTALLYGSAQKVFPLTAVYVNTPPSAPSSLRAGTRTTSSIQLLWSASTDNRGVKEYRIYRNGTRIATTTSLSFTDSNLSRDTAYSYQVSAVDYEGAESAKSRLDTRTCFSKNRCDK